MNSIKLKAYLSIDKYDKSYLKSSYQRPVYIERYYQRNMGGIAMFD